MGLVYVVGFCTTDFPDGTTGSVPDAWAWAALARTSDPTSANRTDRNNVFIRLPLWTQRTVTWLSDGTTGHLLSSRTNWRSFVSLSRYGQLGPPACSRDHGTSGVAAKSQRASRRRCGVLETTEQPGRLSSGDRPVHLGRLDARGRPDRNRGAGRARHQGVGRGRPAGSGPRSGTPSRIAGRDPSWPRRPAVVLTSLDGTVLMQQRHFLDVDHEPAASLDQLARSTADLLATGDVDRARVLAVGVAVSAPVVDSRCWRRRRCCWTGAVHSASRWMPRSFAICA